ncbi:MAG: DUF1844 domain-containing protein [Planctomycetota bacterium]
MSEEKKIIIDEDWKSQVEAEKEAAAQSPPATDPTPAPAAESAPEPPAAAGGEPPGANDIDPPMPPASIGMLISSLATEAMISMGHFPHPLTGDATPRRNQAKYLIDTLDVLKQKTAGNLTDDESKAIEDVLHQLRMAFVTNPAPPQTPAE